MSPVQRAKEMAEKLGDADWRLISEWCLRIGTAAIIAMGGYIFVQVLDGQAENRIKIAEAATQQAEMQKENAKAMLELHVMIQNNTASIREIKANRYTIADAFDAEKRQFERTDEIKNLIAALERRLPTRAEFDAITLLIRDLRDDLKENKAKPQ